MSWSSERDDVQVDDVNREAARRALAANWSNLNEGDPKYGALLEGLAKFHRLFGSDRFELRYNLRPPKGRVEEWTKQFIQEQITEEEYRAKCKADAERPIDLPMLTAFCDAYQGQLEHYSGVLQESVLKPSEEGTSAWQAHEKAIDGHIAALSGKFGLWRENLETVFEFLEELRVTSGHGLVRLGEFEGTSAHWLAQLVCSRMIEAWRSCRDVSDRSHRDRRYLYAARAIDLFQQWRDSFPSPQSIGERLREEYVLARVAIRGKSTALVGSQPLQQGTSDSATDASIDNESRELILIGDIFSLVGRAGHIFRATPNCDWGIDGEIEFKDANGKANGQRVYVQLKSGDSHLSQRADGGEEIFTVKNVRHLEYWVQHAYPVMLVIRQSNGLIRWMDVSAYLKANDHANRQIVFRGEPLTADAIRETANKLVKADIELPDPGSAVSDDAE